MAAATVMLIIYWYWWLIDSRIVFAIGNAIPAVPRVFMPYMGWSVVACFFDMSIPRPLGCWQRHSPTSLSLISLVALTICDPIFAGTNFWVLRYWSRQKLRRRISVVGVFRCTRAGCDITFKTFALFSNHMCRAHDLVPYTLIKCVQCERCFRSEKSHEWHVKHMHGEERLCDKCDFVASSKAMLMWVDQPALQTV